MANLAIPALLGLASYMARNKQQGTPAANQTDNTQIMGANQDTEDMEAGQTQNAAPTAIPAQPAMQAGANQSQAEINRLMGQDANASGVPVSPSVMTQKNPSFKQAFAQARLAGEPTFTWEGKPGVTFTTKYLEETIPGKTKPNASMMSGPDQSDAETKRLKAANAKVATRPTPVDSSAPDESAAETARLKAASKKAENKKSSSNRVPTPEEAAANRKAAIDKLASMGQSVSDYVGNFETPAERSSRERKEKAAKSNSKGGKIKAFAKGGSVSSRGDGIAKKGFTKGRMV